MGIRIGGSWYQLEGQGGFLEAGLKNVVQETTSEIWASEDTYGKTDVSDAQVSGYIASWLKSHPKYGLNASNCQAFVMYMLRKLGFKPRFKNQGKVLSHVALHAVKSLPPSMGPIGYGAFNFPRFV
jgi:hypothetical protein